MTTSNCFKECLAYTMGEFVARLQAMAYFRWAEGEMVGHLIAANEADARRQLDEPVNPELIVTRVEGPLDSVDFQEADMVLGDHHAAVLAHRRLGLRLTETQAERKSHFGGSPRLSPEHAWPGGGAPLPLLLELDLQELVTEVSGAALDLPQSGYLAVFFDPAGPTLGFSVLYSASGAPTRAAPPACSALESRSVLSGLELVSPHPEEPAVIELLGDDVELLESYAELYREHAEGDHLLLGQSTAGQPKGFVQHQRLYSLLIADDCVLSIARIKDVGV